MANELAMEMDSRRVATRLWRYYTGTWVLPVASLLLLILAVRDVLIPTIPAWVPLIEFPVFLFIVFAPFVDGARREHRWHLARGSARFAADGVTASWWRRQFRFAFRQFREPWCWSLLLGKILLLVLVGRFAPAVVKVLALAPDAVALVAIGTILGSNWRRQRLWDRFVPAAELPGWADRYIRNWPVTTAVAGMALALTCCGMAFYFLAGGAWPVEFLCGLQGFWMAVPSLRLLSPAAAWRQTTTQHAGVQQAGRSAA